MVLVLDMLLLPAEHAKGQRRLDVRVAVNTRRDTLDDALTDARVRRKLLDLHLIGTVQQKPLASLPL
eukprot:5147167-Pyramimonas_sp.AAC.1